MQRRLFRNCALLAEVKIVGFARVVQTQGTVSSCDGLTPNMVNFYPGALKMSLTPRAKRCMLPFSAAWHTFAPWKTLEDALKLCRGSFGPFEVDDAFQAS